MAKASLIAAKTAQELAAIQEQLDRIEAMLKKLTDAKVPKAKTE